ncbi:MAG: cellulase family glycosylhydrolase [Bacteroidetes bacterium]|nr:cellulase family glycosylhydrolase [Bacteroidota bacterium]
MINFFTSMGLFICLFCTSLVAQFQMQTGLTYLANEADEFIRVASDGWHFETAVSQQPFVPWGVNYYDPATFHSDPFAAFDVIGQFDSTRTDRHFAKLDSIGVNIVRIFLSVVSFEPELRLINESSFLTLDKLIELAKKYNLRIIFDLINDWEGAPGWESWEYYAESQTIQGYEFYVQALGNRYADEPAVFAWSLKNEPYVRGPDSGIMGDLWPIWVHFRYQAETDLAEAWDDYPRAGESWNQIQQPTFDEFTALNDPGNPRLFDYQLFREDIAYNWTRRLSDMLRAVDPNHLITLGLDQHSAPIKHVDGFYKTYTAFNPKKIAPLMDYISIHAYNWWDNNVGKFIEGVLRYAFTSKPVILEEYNLAENNSSVDELLNSTSGWLHWGVIAFPEWEWQDNLFDENEQLTSLGQDFNNIAGWIKDQIPTRAPDVNTIELDLKQVLTSIDAQNAVYNEYIAAANSATGPVGFNVMNYHPPLVLNLTAPAGGEQWTTGQQVLIQWNVIELEILYNMTVDLQISRDGGINWEQITNNIPNTGSFQWTVTEPASDLCMITVTDHKDANVFSINLLPFSIDIMTAVELVDEEIPATYRLAQNYPNPFNPLTTIAFDLPQSGIVTLKVYDVLGREVAVLTSGNYPAGSFKTRWEAIGFSSGVYFYKIQAGTYFETKKLILLR